MNEPQTAVAESSPASQTFEIPTDLKANLEWRKTGELPGAKEGGAPKEESAPSKDASAEKSAESAAASATANKQEKAKPQNSAAARLSELLQDLKDAGYTPAELKTLRREAKQAEAAQPEASTAKPPEKTVNPPKLEMPAKPKWGEKNADGSEKWDTWEKYEDARDEYHEKVAELKARAAVEADRQARQSEAQQQRLAQRVADAKARYGDQAESTIGAAVRGIMSDSSVNPIVKGLLDESPVLLDVLFTLGSDAAELASFVDLAKTNPGAAIRKVALLEHLVQQELNKGSGTARDKGGEAAGERDSNGKFVSKTPAKEKPAAPPPPEELNTRRSADPDALDAAVRDGNFEAFKDEEDRRDLARARRRGA